MSRRRGTGLFPRAHRKGLSGCGISKPWGGTSGSMLAANANPARLLNCSAGVCFGLEAEPGTGKCILLQLHWVQCQARGTYILQVTVSNGLLAVASSSVLTRNRRIVLVKVGHLAAFFFFPFFIPFCYLFFLLFPLLRCSRGRLGSTKQQRTNWLLRPRSSHKTKQ